MAQASKMKKAIERSLFATGTKIKEQQQLF